MDPGFFPDADRARALDLRMRTELATSLEHTLHEIQTQQPDSDAARRCVDLAEELRDTLTLLRSPQRVSPALFASYYQLVMAALNGSDDLADCISRLSSHSQPRDQMTFHDMSVQGLGSMEQLALYQISLDTDEKLSFAFLPPEADRSLHTRESVQRALALMRQTSPEHVGEFEALVVEVLLAAAAKTPGAARFDGASSYMLWGALALSVDDDKSDLEMLETLAHESGHSLLFGLTVDEPLVRNPDDELYPSPLRPDPRPMDGIYHATFVSARMHYAIRTARDSGLLNTAQHSECTTLLQASRRAFRDGYAVVTRRGDLTDSGYKIMQGAADYMAQFTD